MKIKTSELNRCFFRKNIGKVFYVKNKLQGFFEAPIKCTLNINFEDDYPGLFKWDYLFVSGNNCFWDKNEIKWIKPYEK